MNPLISIIIPVFNRDKLISETLDSILTQSYKNWECIIVDDHSTDDTQLKIEPYLIDKRFHQYKRPNDRKKGANSCRNYGLEKAKGSFIHWFDSDDLAHPRYLEICLDLLKGYDVDFCRFSRATFKGEFNYKFDDQEQISTIQKIDQTAIEKLLKNELPFNTCNVIWRRSSIGDQRFNENIVYGDEWEYYPRLLAQGLKGVSIENTLFFGRKHENSTTYEFWNQDPVRRRSKIKAVKLVIDHLKQKDLLSPSLVKYFLQMGFFLKDLSIIDYTLRQTDSGCLEKMKYKWGYRLYPFLRPFLKLKGNLKRL